MRDTPWILAAVAALASGPAAQALHEHAGGPVVVNEVRLPATTLHALTLAYGPVPAGRYWYDPVSGLWGLDGGPSTGQIMPGLELGGPLRADASGGGTGVFVNGREIHVQELRYLRGLFGVVNPGRYWLNASMIGGYEGGPATFDLRPGAGGGGGYNRDTLGGGLMSDGSCAGYLHPSGASVMSGNC